MTAHIYKKGDYYHIMISYYDDNHKRRQKSISTGLTVSGNNKRKVEQKKLEILKEWQDKIVSGGDVLFSEYLKQWLEDTKHTVKESTYHSYRQTVLNVICPYFEGKKIKLYDLEPQHIQDFYNFKLNDCGVTANTIHHYHANISKALNYAVKMGRIKSNPAKQIDLPKKEQHTAEVFTADELKTLLEYVKGSDMEVVVLLASWFGLRRGEIIGLKWSCVDFENGILSITGTITDKGESGSRIKNMKYRNSTKTASSMRAFSMPKECSEYLRELKNAQDRRKKKYRNYNHKWDEYVCVRENGDLIPLDYVTRRFPKLCENCGLKRLNFHELRHTNISLLLQSGASIKELQEWAGHSSYTTTANIYAHLSAKSKQKLTSAIENILC